MSEIKNIIAREILDSRGYPTVEVDVYIDDNRFARGSCPSGASTGTKEAIELRDGDASRFHGKGAIKAVKNVNTVIRDVLVGKSLESQSEIDKLLIDLDGTPNKSHLGANATTAVSIATLRASALCQNKPLFAYLNPKANTLPIPLMNIINGGAHASNQLDIQEFMIVPIGASSFKNAIEMGANVFHSLKKTLNSKNLGTAVGDEGGFAIDIRYTKEALELLIEAIEISGYKLNKDFYLALDVAASELYQNGIYTLAGEGLSLNSDQLIRYYDSLLKDYPIFSIEDAMHETDFTGWENITKALGSKVQLVGDDVFVTNKAILEQGIKSSICNAILIKPNQVGTLTEAFDTIRTAQSHKYNCVISHRSGETEDTTISHIAVGMECAMIKTGSLCRVDRTAKYNELIRIEEALGNNSKYANITTN